MATTMGGTARLDTGDLHAAHRIAAGPGAPRGGRARAPSGMLDGQAGQVARSLSVAPDPLPEVCMIPSTSRSRVPRALAPARRSCLRLVILGAVLLGALL